MAATEAVGFMGVGYDVAVGVVGDAIDAPASESSNDAVFYWFVADHEAHGSG